MIGARVEPFAKEIEKLSLRFSFETIPVIISREVEIWQVQDPRFKGIHHRHVSYRTKRLLQIVHKRLLRLIAAELVKKTHRRLQTNCVDGSLTLTFQNSVSIIQCQVHRI
jgi:hypothetical protein